MLTLLLAVSMVALTVFGFTRDGFDPAWLLTVALILPCVLGAMLLRPRRLPSTLVAAGLTVACGSFVLIFEGLTEAHFMFFIVIAALALYRDWAPFGVFLIGATLHEAVFGALIGGHNYAHHSAIANPWLWALLYGLGVLAAAAFQVAAWKLTEAEERRAQDSLAATEAQLSFAFDETPVPMSLIAPDGRILRVNAACRTWLGLPEQLLPGYTFRDVPLTPVGYERGDLMRDLMSGPGGSTRLTRAYRRHDDDSVIGSRHTATNCATAMAR
jgi:PAS domain-containing protein